MLGQVWYVIASFPDLCCLSYLSVLLYIAIGMVAIWQATSGICFAVLWGCLRFVIVVFPDHTHLLFSMRAEHFLYFNNSRI